ncbi:MAG TPA: hypothetical protein EYP58_03695, partial [bacterium (Candidatus Stahlbacteria)]|nr:hypothetical protein [Candidatus Stahlbacteria bacterium]
MEFLRPGLLYLLPISAIPIVIHLLSRFRLKTIRFPTVQLLSSTEYKRLSWLKIRDLLLLILRTIVLLSLILALSKPTFRKIRHIEEINLIIDDSFSMEPLFNQAKEIATRVIHDYDVVTVRRLSEPKPLEGSKAELIDAVHKMEATGQHLTIANIKVPGQKLLISDLTVPLFSEIDEAIDTIYTIMVNNHNSNLQIYDVKPADPVILPGVKNRIKATIRNVGPESEETTISLITANRSEEKKIKIESDQSSSIVFETTFERPGLYEATVRINSPDIRTDNERYIAFRIPAQLRVGIFYQDSAGINYLSTAMRTALFEHRIHEIGRLTKVHPEQFELIILYGLNETGPWTTKIINTWITQRKPLIIFLRGMPRAGLKKLVTRFIEPIRWQESNGQIPIIFVHTHPITRFEHTSPEAYRFLKSKTSRGRILAWVDQYPLIILNDNTALFTTCLSLKETDLPIKNIFIPLLYRLVSHLISGGENQYILGKRVKLANYELTVKGPSGQMTTRNGYLTFTT